MVSQFAGRRDSPADPWEGIGYGSENTDGSPRLLDTDRLPCQVDVRLTRHKAAWTSPLCAQRLTGQSRGTPSVGAAPSPVGSSSLTLGDSLAVSLPLPEETAAQGSGKKSRDFSQPAEEREVLPPSSEVARACLGPPHAAASADEGVVQVGRSESLNSFSSETFVLPDDVEKENSHFYAVDMIISAMEKVKWHLWSQPQPDTWSAEEASGPPGSLQAPFHAHVRQEPGASTSADTGYGGCAVLQVSPVPEAPTSHVLKETCKCSLDGFTLESEELNYITESYSPSCRSSKSATYTPDFTAAELLARELFQVFRKCWMMCEANYKLPVSLTTASSVVMNEGNVQEDFDPSVNAIPEVTLPSRIRGTEDWAPPRFQIILQMHPPLKRDMVVVAQNFLCAGCGASIEPKFVKRLRYCEYLGKYFCERCHAYEESCIPARILTSWDFRKCHVSSFSKWLLDSIWHWPVFSLLSHSHSLYGKAKELEQVKDIQEQLFHIKKMLRTCRFADRALQEFKQVPSHLTEELHLFSLEDLVRTKRGLLAPLLKDVLKASLMHVATCELCQGKGFICEFCQSTTVIFPFQTATCRRCSACRACFHKECFQPSGCPRCARITARRRLPESLASAAP